MVTSKTANSTRISKSKKRNNDRRPEHPVITFPGLKEITAVTATLSHGITPSAIRLDFPKQDKPLNKGGDLKIEFDGKKVVFKDCLVDQSTSADSRSGQVTSIMVFDRRWRWAYQSVSFAFNTRNDAGEIRVKPKTKELSKEGRKPDEIKLIQKFLNTKKSANAIGDWFLARMGQAGAHNDLPDDDENAFPEIAGEEVRPAAMLARLCDWYKCTIVLRTDNTVSVERLGVPRPGTPKELPKDLPIARESSAVALNVRPEKVRIVTKPILYQWDFALEPVGEDTDGNFVPIDQLSYKPGTGWSDLPGMAHWYLDLDEASEEAKRKFALASRSVYRMYRPTWRGGPRAVDEDENNVNEELLEGSPLQLGDTQVVTYDQIAPFKLRQATTIFKQGAKRPREPLVYGQYLDWTTWDNNVADVDDESDPDNVITGFDVPPFDADRNHKSACRVGFSVLPDTGIVVFNQSMLYDDQSGGSFVPARLFLRIAFHVKDVDTRARKRHEIVRSVRPPVVAGVVQTQVVESLEPIEIYDFEKADKDRGADGAIVLIPGSPINNSKEIDDEAEPYLKALQRKILDDTGPENITYNGLIDSIELDGAVRSIQWSVSTGGVTTRIQRNQDLGSSTTLGAGEIRLIEQQAEAVRNNDRTPTFRLKREADERDQDQF